MNRALSQQNVMHQEYAHVNPTFRGTNAQNALKIISTQHQGIALVNIENA